MSEIILVLGGSRSGKSHWAEQIAANANQNVIYIATAGIKDQEMADRVQAHRERRPDHWQTIEETHNLTGALMNVEPDSVVLVDCLTMWITNVLLDQNKPAPQSDSLQKEQYILDHITQTVTLAREKRIKLILVSNEVGWGLVPDYALGRLFRDMAGKTNQHVAQLADQVYLVIAGLVQELKAAGPPQIKEVF